MSRDANDQAMLDSYCTAKSEIIRKDDAAIDSIRGSSTHCCLAKAHTILPKSTELASIRLRMAEAEIACMSGTSTKMSVAKAHDIFARSYMLYSFRLLSAADAIASSRGWLIN